MVQLSTAIVLVSIVVLLCAPQLHLPVPPVMLLQVLVVQTHHVGP